MCVLVGSSSSQIIGGIFRCYAVVFAIFVGVLETEWEFIIKFWKVCSALFSPFRFAQFGMLQIGCD